MGSPAWCRLLKCSASVALWGYYYVWPSMSGLQPFKDANPTYMSRWSISIWLQVWSWRCILLDTYKTAHSPKAPGQTPPYTASIKSGILIVFHSLLILQCLGQCLARLAMKKKHLSSKWASDWYWALFQCLETITVFHKDETYFADSANIPPGKSWIPLNIIILCGHPAASSFSHMKPEARLENHCCLEPCLFTTSFSLE